MASRRRLLLGALAAGAMLTLAAAGWWFFWPASPPGPPALVLDGVDAAVAAELRRAQADVEASPQSPRRWGNLGSLLLANDFHDEALECLRRAEQLDPNDDTWPYLQGMALLFRGSSSAATSFTRAARLRPGEPAPRLRLAELLLARDDLDPAEEAFRQVLALKPGNPRALLGLGLIAQRRGRWADSLDPLEKAVASPFAAKAAHAALAAAHLRLKDAAAAERHRQAAEESATDTAWPDPYLEPIDALRMGLTARIDRVDGLLAQQAVGPALRLLEELLAEHPSSDEGRLRLAQALIRSGSNDRAEQELRRLTADHPRLPEGPFLLGVLLLQRGAYAEAEVELRRAVGLRPGFAMAHYNLGRCLEGQSRKDAARDSYRAAVGHRPQLVPAHVGLARVLREQGDRAAAREHLEQAIRLQSSDPPTKMLLEEERKHWPSE